MKGDGEAMEIDGEKGEKESRSSPSQSHLQPMRDPAAVKTAETGLMTAAAIATSVASPALAAAALESTWQGKAVAAAAATSTSVTVATLPRPAAALSGKARKEDESSNAAPLIEAGFKAGAAAATSTSPPATASTASSKQNILPFSRGDRPHAKTLGGNMTISEPRGCHPQEVVEPMAVDHHLHRRRESEDSDEAPINLAYHPATTNSTSSTASIANAEGVSSPSLHGLSAKMRLKKQRLEAVAQAAAAMQLTQMQPLESSSSSSSSSSISSSSHEHSALHRLAEAAERKQEEEMMEMNPPYQGNTKIKSLYPSREDLSITPLLATPSPDSAIHSVVSGGYSPSRSPIQSRQVSGLSSPFSLASLSRNNSDASQHANAVSPHNSPVQIRHGITATTIALPTSPVPPSAAIVARPMTLHPSIFSRAEEVIDAGQATINVNANANNDGDLAAVSTQPGISRQQLINSPCPVCGDKISGFHYGIFSCESCKGFFKRTVQNKKNYQCLRGANCPISIATRKKCPACRFNKCLNTGMKLEAIREDRTRGGRSTYQCSYTLPANLTSSQNSSANNGLPIQTSLRMESEEEETNAEGINSTSIAIQRAQETVEESMEVNQQPSALKNVPLLIQEIMDVEHLWFSTRASEKDLDIPANHDGSNSIPGGENMVQTLTNMADKRLFKLVKWCKSLPLFKNILIDDQISLLINAWCELLVFSCCYRSIETPGVIRVSNQKRLTLEEARSLGIEKWIEKMLNFSEQLRRLRIDSYEYVSMKVIVLLTSSDASVLKEAGNVSDSQEKVVQALQHYTASQYPEMPSKFAELLLRMPELHRVCQGCKEMLCPRQPMEGETTPGFNLLMELLRGDL